MEIEEKTADIVEVGPGIEKITASVTMTVILDARQTTAHTHAIEVVPENDINLLNHQTLVKKRVQKVLVLQNERCGETLLWKKSIRMKQCL